MKRFVDWYLRMNRASLVSGTIISLSLICTGAFRFAESILWHHLAGIPILLATPFYLAVLTYQSAVFVGSVNTLETFYQRRNWFWCNLACFYCFINAYGVIMSTYPVQFTDTVARLNWNIDQPGYWWHLAVAFFGVLEGIFIL